MPQYSEPRPSVPADVRRQAYIEAGHQCSIVQCPEHTYLELHHINHNREDNRIENVILLCDKHHKMAHAGVIEKKDLREYKKINRRLLGLDDTYDLPAEAKAEYLDSLSGFLSHEIEKLEGYKDTTPIHVEPSLEFHEGTKFTPPGRVLKSLYDFVISNHKGLLRGNGGSGKTVTVLSLLIESCDVSRQDSTAPFPVFVPLHRLTPATPLLSLIRSSIGRHGLNLTNKQVEALLSFGRLFVVFDGLNEIHTAAVSNGAVEDLINLLDTYPDSYFLITSRYIPLDAVQEIPKLDMLPWDSERVEAYLRSRLGEDLGKEAYCQIGDQLDFEWLSGCSIAGLCTNPLTLWIYATITEEKQRSPDQGEDIVDALVDLAVKNRKGKQATELATHKLREVFEDLAYLMIARGNILSIDYDAAIEISAQILSEQRQTGLLPHDVDAYKLLSILMDTGLIRRVNEETVEWLHQILQEKLSVNASERRFGAAVSLTKTVLCPSCGYRPIDYFERGGMLWGRCDESSACSEFEIKLPEAVYTDLLRGKLTFIDHTGLPREEGATAIPNAFFDEHWMYRMPVSGMTYISALMHAQKEEGKEIDTTDFIDSPGFPSLMAKFEIVILEMAGMIHREHTGDVTKIHIYLPAVNPSLRLVAYHLVTVRELSYEDLEEDPEKDERFTVTSPEKEQYEEERRRNNLPIPYTYPFLEKKKAKVFHLAQKLGGRVIRQWGPYREIICEFPGEAWDFSRFASRDLN